MIFDLMMNLFFRKMRGAPRILRKKIDPIAYLGLGTNLGDRLANLHQAAAALPPQVTVLRSSSIYETEPWGYRDQPEFLNQVLEVETSLSAAGLLQYLKGIERKLGRRPAFRYGPRLIDLDILFYGDQVIDSADLAVPHPRLPERAFVLAPLAELAPGLLHPATHKSIQEMLSQVDRAGVKKFLAGPGDIARPG